MTDSPRRPGYDLWAITAYFNPFHFRRRLRNYRTFRRELAVPLATVEIAFDGDFELGPDDADVLVSLQGGDVMWQRERLLNVAAAAVPAACRKLVWMDCDTVFGADDWPERVSRALDEWPLVQPFERVYHLARDVERPDPAGAEFAQQTIPVAVAAGRPARECMGGVRQGFTGTCVMGMGWAVRREVVERVGIYDACIVGGGSRQIVCAAYGCFDEAVRLALMNGRQRDHYLAWAERFYGEVRGRVAAVGGDLFHLWHGSMADRQYRERYEGLTRFDFDPYLDLAVGPDRAWRWNSAKPELHRYVRDYLAARKDDG